MSNLKRWLPLHWPDLQNTPLKMWKPSGNRKNTKVLELSDILALKQWIVICLWHHGRYTSLLDRALPLKIYLDIFLHCIRSVVWVKRNSKLHHNHTVQFAEQPFQNSPEMLAGQNPPRRDCLSFSSLHHPCQYFLEKPEIKCVKITGSVMRWHETTWNIACC